MSIQLLHDNAMRLSVGPDPFQTWLVTGSFGDLIGSHNNSIINADALTSFFLSPRA